MTWHSWWNPWTTGGSNSHPTRRSHKSRTTGQLGQNQDYYVDPSSSIANPPVALDQTTTVDWVQQFMYLGLVIAADGLFLPELQARIAKASAAMG